MAVCVVYALKWLLSVLKWQKYWFNLRDFLIYHMWKRWKAMRRASVVLLFRAF